MEDNKNENKVSFEEYINNKIKDSNENEEIKKEDLIKEIEEKVEKTEEIIEKINIIFSNKESLKLLEIKNEINKKDSNPKKELLDLIKPEKEKKNIPSDLDFLSQDLPKDKNREKILTQNFFSNSNYETIIKEESPEKKNISEIDIDLSKIESGIKPANLFDDINKNENEKKEKPKEMNKPIYNPNYNYDSSLSNNFNINKKIILPKNEDYIISSNFNNDEDDISNILFKSNKNDKNKNILYEGDYFYSIYKTYCPKNKIIKHLKHLNEKVYKAVNKPISVNGIYGNFQKGNNDLNNFQIKNNVNNYNKSNSILDKVEKEKNNIINSDNKKNNYYYEFKPKNFDLKKSNEKKAYVQNLKDELKNFSINIDNQKNKRSNNSGFDEINKKLEELYKKNKKEEHNKNNVEKEEFKEEVKEEVKEEIKSEIEKTTIIETKKIDKKGNETVNKIETHEIKTE